MPTGRPHATERRAHAEDDFLGADRFCDIVMKGGVTSGVVYPLAITALAEKFIFRNIAGTSVGAIAAALTAAAEYDRRFHRSRRGFAKLARLPDFLGTTREGKTNLIRQFWADTRELQWQLDAALKLVGDGSFGKKFLRFELQLGLWYWWVWVAPLAVMVALADPLDVRRLRWPRVGAAAALGLSAGACGLPIWYVLRVATRIARNQFGWCHGHDARNDELDTRAEAPLSDWLADTIDELAGLPFRRKPLTFGDLRGRTGSVAFGDDDGEDVVTVRMMTTCLSLQLPFSLPFDKAVTASRQPVSDTGELHGGEAPIFWWRPDEFSKYFPQYVMQHLIEVTTPHERFGDYRSFPRPDDLPLIVAARMSLSFPVLLCAVPLYQYIDKTMLRAWFSDGGLTSNLPIHFFDNPIPRWPTFALDLLGVDPRKSNDRDTFIESAEPGDQIDPREPIDKDDKTGDLLAFFGSILDTTRTWRDRVLARLPGYADRTVGIRLKGDEGGLNLNMDARRIKRLTDLGRQAADTLIDAFAPRPRFDAPFWQGHRWTRYTAAMAAHAKWEADLHKGFEALPSADWQASYPALIASAVPPNVPGTPSASPPESAARGFRDAADAAEAGQRTKELADCGARDRAIFGGTAPHPHADLGPKPRY